MSRATVREFQLRPRGALPAEDRGELLNAEEIVTRVCQNRISAKTWRKLFAARIGMKPGREFLFFENEARSEWANYLDSLKAKSGSAA